MDWFIDLNDINHFKVNLSQEVKESHSEYVIITKLSIKI